MKIETKKFFTRRGLITIYSLLIVGVVFGFIEKSGKIDQYYREKNPPMEIPEMPQPRIYKIGFVTDAHARVTKEGILRPISNIPMRSFVFEMNNNFYPDFAVDGGDIIDGTRRFGLKSRNDHNAISEAFNQIFAPKYHVLGNHDLRGMTRESWNKLNKYDKSYYYFDYEKLRVIIFDSTLMTTDVDATVKGVEYKKELAWLENLLKNSDGYKKIIFSHYPLVSVLRKGTPLELITKLNELFSQYGVRAVFSGHVEVPYYEKIGRVDYFVVPGFFRSEATGMLWKDSFAEINVGLKNYLTLFYKNEGSDEYKKLTIPSEEYEVVKNEILEKVNFLAPVD